MDDIVLLKAVALEMLLWDPEQASFGIEEYVLPRFEVPLGETSVRRELGNLDLRFLM